MLTTREQVHGLKRPDAQLEYPVRVRGVVTYANDQYDGVVQDATRGVWIRHLATSVSRRLQVGDFVEVEGVTGPGDFAPLVTCQRLTCLGGGRMPDPVHPTWDQLMNGSLDCQYVELEG